MIEFLEHLKVYWFENSYAQMVMAVAIAVLTLVVGFVFSRMFRAFIKKQTREVENDPVNYTFLRHAIFALIYTVGFSCAIWAVPSLRTFASSLLAGAGILAVAVGFAAQQALANIISGIFIIIFKPFRVSDRIHIGQDIAGVVEDITLRHTVIRNFENRRVIIPNSVISSETLVNSDIVDEKICKIMNLGVGYGANIQLARAIIQEETMRHHAFMDNRRVEQQAAGEPPVVVRVTNWGDFSINLRVWFWAADAAVAWQMSCDLRESIKARFDREGVEIPFPYQNVIHHHSMAKAAPSDSAGS